MSKRAEFRRLARDDAKFEQYVESGFMPWPDRRMIGDCRRCWKRSTMLVRPLKICTRCVREAYWFRWAADFLGVKL